MVRTLSHITRLLVTPEDALEAPAVLTYVPLRRRHERPSEPCESMKKVLILFGLARSCGL